MLTSKRLTLLTSSQKEVNNVKHIRYDINTVNLKEINNVNLFEQRD